MICTLLELWRIACSCISIWLACSYFCEFNFFVPFFFRCASFKWWEHTKTPQGWEDCPVPYLGSVSQLGRRIPTFSRILPLNTINNIVWFRFPFCSPFSRFRCFFGEKPACFFFQTSKMTCCSLTTFCQQALPWCLRLGDWHSSDGCSATGVPDVKRLVTGAGSEDFWIRVWTAQNGLLRKRCFTLTLTDQKMSGGNSEDYSGTKKTPISMRFFWFSTAFGWAISREVSWIGFVSCQDIEMMQNHVTITFKNAFWPWQHLVVPREGWTLKLRIKFKLM